jgi:transposase
LWEADISVTIVQPKCVRYFAYSLKLLAKTDAIDSTLIARFAQSTQPRLSQQPNAKVRELRALRDRRAQLVEDRIREQNRLEACYDERIAEKIGVSINAIKAAIRSLDKDIVACIKQDGELNAKSTLMQKEKGIGPQVVATLLSHLGELGSVNRQQIAAIGGLAPYDQSSGKWQGRRRIFGGRAEVRSAMYMAALTAIRYDTQLQSYYQKLVANGKQKKVAIIACARKLLVRLNTLLAQ